MAVKGRYTHTGLFFLGVLDRGRVGVDVELLGGEGPGVCNKTLPGTGRAGAMAAAARMNAIESLI